MEENIRKQLRKNLLSGSTWGRGFFMLMYGFICYIAILVTAIVIIFQFGVVLLSGKLNERLLPVGQSLSLYIHQIFNYLTYISDEKPFPLSSWPSADGHDTDPIDTNPIDTDLTVDLFQESEPPQKNG